MLLHKSINQSINQNTFCIAPCRERIRSTRGSVSSVRRSVCLYVVTLMYADHISWAASIVDIVVS